VVDVLVSTDRARIVRSMQQAVSQVVLLVALVLSTGCALGSGEPSVSLENLQGSWRLVDASVPEGARVPTMSIEADGGLSGVSGVNRFSGVLDVVVLADGGFALGPVASTRMAGPPAAMEFEARFLRDLEAADDVVLDDGELVLKAGDDELLRFARPSGND
jgi:heat shock protein HslJ